MARVVGEIAETEKKVTVKVTVKVTANQKRMLEELENNPYVTQEELAGIVGIL